MKKILTTAAAVAIAASAAHAQDVTLRIQTHYASEHPSGVLAAQFADDVQVMSGGEIAIEMFYSSSVVATTETFDAAINGILDCDMTGGAYQTGKNPAFQFVGDIMGGYDTPWQQISWLYYGGGYDAAQELYNAQGMQLIGWWLYGQESLSSSKPLAGPDDLKGWKFRSPPGLETEIFTEMGATPIVMDFTEIFTALETGIIDGADASGLYNNVGLGLYDIVSHATYPGFHSMPSDHLACNQAVWDGLSEKHQRIIDTAMQKLTLHTALSNEKKNAEAAAELQAKGVTLHNWSAKDRADFRKAAQTSWDRWAEKTPEAAALVASHREYLTALGLIAE
ncbi:MULTISPECIES: TRAP transporter substrate-binding protein [Mameliella]|uniref:Putative TRAP dicarboxylate transporter, DctP subunit n=1 Tax=Mameliella alba TaxID=561184 RepID=A0A0B3RYT3_9RHOB|nr:MULTISPECIES: TRAP transporter substrate-binding protein [Mameliella]MBV6636686.1 TRAP transporter substrate-binding protein [Mameliella sp.]MCR9273770.1 TRAP transporter substrate-binding protein [Paracoccaceae bacterium]KHQ51883.1 putative TRAP dicarboxylate transporter, DctP subunit [Mameliella alba]MBY6122384.1 TRAP transporter substrate-binding protein [Mameliella alba]MDD9730386.1 TRAP transporter substrate-binding protein [Mameliella sp. AT18]